MKMALIKRSFFLCPDIKARIDNDIKFLGPSFSSCKNYIPSSAIPKKFLQNFFTKFKFFELIALYPLLVYSSFVKDFTL